MSFKDFFAPPVFMQMTESLSYCTRGASTGGAATVAPTLKEAT